MWTRIPKACLHGRNGLLVYVQLALLACPLLAVLAMLALELSDGLEARSSKAAPPARRPASDCLAWLSDGSHLALTLG